MSVSLDVLKSVATIKPGTKISSLGASVASLIGAPGVGGLVETIDEAADGKTYVAGTPSCLKVA